LEQKLSLTKVCKYLSISRKTLYRNTKTIDNKTKKPTAPYSHRRLSEEEKQKIMKQIYSSEFVDKSPYEIVNTLLDRGITTCSVRTMYRLLHKKGESQERRPIVRKRNLKKPELIATKPNEVWSWDITKLRTENKLEYYYLYVIMDIYSRYIVGWGIYREETGELARHLMDHCLESQKIKENLTVHSDRGSPMKSNVLNDLLKEYNVIRSLSRPHVSNDNPFSEAQFKTFKYSPGYPGYFTTLKKARSYHTDFVHWYNTEHKHSGIGYYTPQSVHYHTAIEVQKVRQNTLDLAFQTNPERYSQGRPLAQEIPSAVYINEPPPVEASNVELR
jgi:putative transposase